LADGATVFDHRLSGGRVVDLTKESSLRCSDRSATSNQIDYQDDDGNHEQKMNQSAADVADESQQPQN
jgi:hypothetical protein